ncbi:MAG: hypothetical protein IKJ43_02720 [Bacilli bacterium]|nr:hypothetical protein [Bacilli bacterium]
MNVERKLDRYLNKHLKESKDSLFKRMFKSKETTFEDMEFYETSSISNGNVFFRSKNINDYIEDNYDNETFQSKLFDYIDQKELKDSDVYNIVGIDRRLFSKIRSNRDYHPSKETVILLGIALKLSEEEIEDLLESASYSLPKNTKFDLIIRFCFKEKIYDLIQINNFLYERGCKTLN